MMRVVPAYAGILESRLMCLGTDLTFGGSAPSYYFKALGGVPGFPCSPALDFGDKPVLW